MEFRDLKLQYLKNRTKIDAAVYAVLSGGNYIGGEAVCQLEERLADYVGVKYCITCANGTDALQLALMAWGIGKGDAVFVPDFTFFSTAEVVPWVQAEPVFVDVDQDTFNLSAQSLEEAVQRVMREGRLIPKAVIAVDLFGQPADFAQIRHITEKYGLMLLEDGAQGLGGRIGEKKACSFGDIATTSFFPAKPLGCYGDGGAIFTNQENWAQLIRSYKVHGKGVNKYDNVRIGLNSRLDTLQAAVLQVKLDIFESQELSAVQDIAKEYTQSLSALIKVPTLRKDFFSSWAQYTVKLDNQQDRDGIQKFLKERNIPSMVYYAKPLHCQKAFEAIWQSEIELVHTEKLCKTVLSLPMHPYMTEKEIAEVVNTIKEYCTKCR